MKFTDGEFDFYTAHYGEWANYKLVVFRVRTDRVPKDRAYEKGMSWFDKLIPSTHDEIKAWLKYHPEFKVM